MKTKFIVTAVAVGGAIFAHTAASGATLTPIAPFVGTDANGFAAIGTGLVDLNNNGWTTGSVSFADSTEEGFLRSPTGDYTLFSYDDTTFGRAVGNDNTVVGYSASFGVVSQLQYNEYVRAADGSVTVLQNPNTGAALHGIAQGINASGAIVGSFWTGTVGHPSIEQGFEVDGSSFTTFGPATPGSRVTARGIANDGTVVGWGVVAGVTEGYVYQGGTYTFVDAPGAVGDLGGTVLEAVNNNGVAVGQGTDASGNAFGFTYNLSTGVFTNIDVPGATSVQTFGINDNGQVVVNSDAGQFIYDPASNPGVAVFEPVAGANLPPNQSEFSIGVVQNQTYFIDPSYATGFIYKSGSGPLFASVLAPTGIAPGDTFQLWLYDSTTHQWTFDTDIQGGVAYDFSQPLAMFELRGIPKSAMIDGSNPAGFVTGLTFASAGQFDGLQIGIGVPEPGAWMLMLAGFGVIGSAVRLDRSRRTASRPQNA